MAPFFRGDTTALLEKTDSLSALLALRSDTLAPLMHSGEEALMAARFFGGKALLGDRATKQALETLGGNYRILLLSTHGKANDRKGEYAYLALSAPGDSFHFEKLYVNDIYNLELRADLVILSACETGIGPLQRGEGIISLARAFAYSGAKSIVTTLWSVDDAGTSQLMQLFFSYLQSGHSKDEALWLAKQAFLSENTDEFYAHPFYWAGFIPIGDMRMMQKE